MSVGRGDSASIVLNGNTLWVTGGYNLNSGTLASTEYVTATGTIFGPDLQMALYGHAMVAINKTCSMVIGGRNWPIYPYTFFYDHSEDEWMINGPSLMQARAHHAAGIVTDDVTDEHFAVVTGGGGTSSLLDSTEILQDGNWVEGKINDIISYLL